MNKNPFPPKEVAQVTKIVAERTNRVAVHNWEKSHEEQKKSRQSCCWQSPIIVDGFEIACCQPSIRSKGETHMAFFTYQKV
jgi:hypothetical protein